MATLGYDDEALEDLVRLALFLAQVEPSAALAFLDCVQAAIRLLEAHPLLGRRVRGELRELVISQGATGYVALYGYSAASGHVQVHRIRHQREAGFDEEDAF